MSDQQSNLFGWDLLYTSVENDIHSNQDVLLCLVHLVLISNGFQCIGIGDSKVLDGTEAKSESLPKGWNDGYAIRYVYQGRLYNLKGTSLDDAIIINLIRVDERTVSMIQLNTRSVIQRSGSLMQMIPECSSIIDVVRKQLIEKVVTSTKTKDSANQTQPETSKPTSSIGINPSRLQDPPVRNPAYPYMPNIHPIDVGGADLNPFGLNPLGVPRNPTFPGGGGMLFVPPGRGGPPDINMGIPGGSLPPGARFDPFRPPDVDRFPRRPNAPDNDEMPPPGFDDMFM
ncbi:proteasome inhibitor [Holotrichia oblita]|uniref:Proteasome inhibitor n=1 Tax=Holotrichia oblita TaxID=644536 RepID=A0ACB9T8I8_HOLOL|nr:proteasome inhibitor [Holotrichia oblita]